MAVVVIAAFVAFLLLGLSRWAHIVRTRQQDLALGGDASGPPPGGAG